MLIHKYNGLIIPHDHPQFQRIKLDLTRTSEDFTGNLTTSKFYENVEGGILIPRNYPIDPIQDHSIDGSDIRVNSKIIPRNDRQIKVMDYLLGNNDGIIKIEPGSGKTVISIHSICSIGKKAIIFVHKTKLRDQWIKEITDFTDLTIENIGILSTATFKKDLDKPIIMSTVQAFCSLLKNKHSVEFRTYLDNAGIGVAFFDECHTSVGPDKFSACSLSLNCKRVYGLSATPERPDGNDDIIRYHLGEVIYYPPTEGELLKPVVYMIYFPFEVYSKHRKYVTWGGQFSLPKYQQQLYNSEKYNITVSQLINKLYKQDRNLLVLGNRTKSLLQLAESCQLAPSEIGIFIPTAVGDKDYHKQLDRVSDTRDLDEAFHTKRVVFSTYTAARDGNNRKNLDTLVMALPTGNVEQAAGRILRTLEGKKQPIVVDLIDTEGPLIKSYDDPSKKVTWFVKSAQKRKEFYIKMGWEVREHKLS